MYALMLVASDKWSDVLLLYIHPSIHYLLNSFFVKGTVLEFIYRPQNTVLNPQTNPLG